MTPGDHRPVVKLGIWEQMRFLLIVDRETNRPARRLLDLWAGTGDHGPELDETFRRMWRTPAG